MHFEYLGPMSLSVDEEYLIRLISYTQPNMSPKIIVTQIDTGLEHEIPFTCTKYNIQNVEFGPKYTKNAKEYHSIFFTVCDDIGRPNSVYACIMNSWTCFRGDGTLFTPLELIMKEENRANFVDVQRTKGCDYVAINSTSKTDNEVYLIGGDATPSSSSKSNIFEHIPWQPILVKKRSLGIQYYVECGNQGDVIILAHQFSNQRLDDDAFSDKKVDKNVIGSEISVFQASKADFPLPASNYGTPIHLHNDTMEFFVEDIDLFYQFLVFYERSSVDSSQRIRVLRRNTEISNSTIISLDKYIPERKFKHCLISPGGNMNFNSIHLNFHIESPLMPPTQYNYDFELNSLSNLSNSSHQSDTRRSDSVRFLVTSKDNALIPLSLYFHNDVMTKGVLLIGYGSYGQNQNLSYNPAFLPLVRRGFSIVSYILRDI